MAVGVSSSEAGNDGGRQNLCLGTLLRTALPPPLLSDNGAVQSTSSTLGHGAPANPSTSQSKRQIAFQVIRETDLEYLQLLGQGGYGKVYLGKWRGTKVAIKKIKEGIQEDDFLKEAMITARLRHPNVVAFCGVVLDDSGKLEGIATEYMIDGSLADAIRKNDRINDFRTKASIAVQAAVAMEYVHGEGVVHFDIKSHNLFVDLRDPENPICKIGDFGLSELKNDIWGLASQRGTLKWMAPELMDGSGWISEKVDVYSFGIFMWELIVEELPYQDRSSSDVKIGVLKYDFRPRVPAWLDYDWRRLMDICWHPDPSMRPTFAKIVSELNCVIDKRTKKLQIYSRRQQAKLPPASGFVQVPILPHQICKKIERKDADVIYEHMPVTV